MKRRILAILLSGLLILNVVGCSQKETNNEKDIPDFAGKEWFFYDEVTAENLVMNLGRDGTYSYHCQCGEPVGDSDLYEKYEYDEDAGVITLTNSYDDSEATIEVVDYNEYHLMLRIDGKVKDFVLSEMNATTDFFMYEGESYLEGYESRCIVVDIQDGKIVYGPNEYDPEGLYKDGPFEEYELAENVSCFDLSVSNYLSVQDGQEYEEFYDAAFTEIGLEEAKAITENGAGTAFLWFDDAMKIEKIVFYGQTSVSSDYISVTVPEELAEEPTQEYLDLEIEEGIYDAAHLNEDGSVVYLMTQEQYDAKIADMTQIYQDSIEEMCDEENYGIVEIKRAEDFSSFEVVIVGGASLDREQIIENLTYMGQMYAVYSGMQVDEIEIIFTNK